MIVALPAVTAVTTPLVVTVAIAAALVLQVTVFPLLTAPFWSFTVAVSWTLSPSVSVGPAGATSTVVTTGDGGGGRGGAVVLPDEQGQRTRAGPSARIANGDRDSCHSPMDLAAFGQRGLGAAAASSVTVRLANRQPAGVFTNSSA